MAEAQFVLFIHPDYYPSGGAKDRHHFVAGAEEAEAILLRLDPNDFEDSQHVNAHLWRPETDEIVRVWAKVERDTVWADITGMERAHPWEAARRLGGREEAS